jgi:hypothetical protein
MSNKKNLPPKITRNPLCLISKMNAIRHFRLTILILFSLFRFINSQECGFVFCDRLKNAVEILN